MQTLKLGGDFLVIGQNAIEYLSTIKGAKAFIVTSGNIARQLGHIDKVEAMLKKAQITFDYFEDVDPDPEISSVLNGAARMREFEPDWIIAIGGGSAMDSAKAMWVAYEHPEFNCIEKFMPPNIIPPTRTKARLICIPTTSGTGSEVTRSVVLSDKTRNLKLLFRDFTLIPDIAILDASFTTSMPQLLTAYTGMDALTHAIEAYVTLAANDFSDAFAEKAVWGIFEYLPLAIQEPENICYRDKMNNFATLAGLSFANVGLGVVHSIAHAFGGIFHVPHGLANAIVLPYVIDFNKSSPIAKEKYNRLEWLLDTTDLRVKIEQLKRKINVPTNMAQVITDSQQFELNLESLVSKALCDTCTLGNPVKINSNEMKALIRNAYYCK